MRAELTIAAAWDCEAASDATMLLTWRVEKENDVGASQRGGKLQGPYPRHMEAQPSPDQGGQPAPIRSEV